LRELHRIHRQLNDLHERLDRGPKQIKARQGTVAKFEAELTQAKADSKAARVGADQKQLLLKSGESKIRELKVKLNAASSNREYQALKDQIAADEMANSVLADEILEALEKIDSFAPLIREAEQNLARGRDELAKAEQQVREQHDLLIGDVQRLEGELKTVEAGLPNDIREVYQRVVRSKGSDAMAQVDGETCGGCYHHLTANIINALLMGRVVCCQSCSRMLYLPEDRTPGAKTK
jgi:predicted  nucleic acid-binding Zn-ribbon protein